ncbi:MAG TPA: helix-turn-helix domain-containing protein [Solirubrobacterales bacterium]|nr:helix-turn-helix domain-containing protein [Solirubrobacterales bacterium]
MRIDNPITDEAVLAELGKRIARTRLERNLSQASLAAEAGVSKTTLERLERGGGIQLESFIRILRALGQLDRLDVVVSEPLPSPIERLETRGRQRQRAREKADGKDPGGTWTWGERPSPDEPEP